MASDPITLGLSANSVSCLHHIVGSRYSNITPTKVLKICTNSVDPIWRCRHHVCVRPSTPSALYSMFAVIPRGYRTIVSPSLFWRLIPLLPAFVLHNYLALASFRHPPLPPGHKLRRTANRIPPNDNTERSILTLAVAAMLVNCHPGTFRGSRKHAPHSTCISGRGSHTRHPCCLLKT